jgi:hypothetical protein
MSKKIYGITLVPRRIYNLALAILITTIVNTTIIQTIGKNNLDTYVNNKYGSQNISCVVDAVAGEAIGEPDEGKKAVVEVIMNRSKMSKYPDSFCEVVHQSKQFSYLKGNQNYKKIYSDPAELYKLTKLVYSHIYDIEKNPKHRILPENVSHYDGKSFKKPYWSKDMIMVKEIAGHQFYAPKENKRKV